ncbi:hypothetical protein ACGFI9_37680 [Micromonospora sp. NPDC048930]|uniref:hypothetical protein n=1 Tax=Micromonospora sp. NPDC048930 TaxID=3364261 RepID=UPI0037132788
MVTAVGICLATGAVGHRAEVVLCRAARAHAALRGAAGRLRVRGRPDQPGCAHGDGRHLQGNSLGCPAQGCGSVGQAGRFTFRSSSDVTLFKWGWSDSPSTPVSAVDGTDTADWTPSSGGAMTCGRIWRGCTTLPRTS